MPIPEQVEQLIERFYRERRGYLSEQYKETPVRVEFIDPLFESLGWDVHNTAGRPEAYKDVIHEAAIKVGGYTKAPDYCFRVGGARKFFLEAKKPSVDLKEAIGPAFQLRRYAWSANLPVSILTDFEEFVVYDCRVEPVRTDPAATARLLYLTYEQYVERWDDVAGIFSREAVLGGSLEELAGKIKAKKGTVTVDVAFLKEIESWRERLARTLALGNSGLGQRELNFAVQLTIDRIIFLRMCEDRGIEPYGQLAALQQGEAVYQRLCQLFHRADDRYNSGLFHFRPEKDRSELPDALTPALAVDDEPLQAIFKGLYYPDSPYEFSVLPVEILGRVYEQFLGKVIRLTDDHQAVVEEKPEVRRAGGVYYTPAFVVDYIVKRTLGRLLAGKRPGPRGGASKIRVLDPACGSGSFLLGAYQYLLDWHRDRYVADGPDKHPKELYQGPGGEWRLTTGERKRILLGSIYGVDVDPQAVEVTKLSLLLKVLEGESDQTLHTQLQLFQERALPDLGNNIKSGNSLIGPDFYDRVQPSLLDDAARHRVNVFDWDAEFPEVMRAGGFDVAIGNPPYIRIQRIGHDESDYLFRSYETPTSKTDISLLFLEQALRLASPSGLVGFICTSQWLSTDYGRKMRRTLSDGRLHEIVDFGSLPVFEGADTYPAIFVLSRDRAEDVTLKRIERADQMTLSGIEQAQPTSIPLSALSESAWSLGGLNIPSILNRSGQPWTTLQRFGNAYIGVLTGMDAAFVVDQRTAGTLQLEDELLFPYAYRGAEVASYAEVAPDARVIYPYREGPDGTPRIVPEDVLVSDYPNIHAHLIRSKNALQERMDSRRLYATGADWYRHLRPGSFRYIRPKKLVIKGIDTRATVGMLGPNTAFNGANCPGIILENLGEYSPYYFLGLLNSRVVTYYLRSVCPAKLGGYTRFNASNVTATPIRTIASSASDRRLHDQIAELAMRMVSLKRQGAAARIAHDRTTLGRQMEATAQRIDRLVYELYGLRPDEIKIVEGLTD